MLSDLVKELLSVSKVDDYVLKVVEELSELSVAVTHYHRGKVDIKDVVDELADVLIQVEKMKVLLQLDTTLDINELVTKRLETKTRVLSEVVKQMGN